MKYLSKKIIYLNYLKTYRKNDMRCKTEMKEENMSPLMYSSNTYFNNMKYTGQELENTPKNQQKNFKRAKKSNRDIWTTEEVFTLFYRRYLKLWCFYQKRMKRCFKPLRKTQSKIGKKSLIAFL